MQLPVISIKANGAFKAVRDYLECTFCCDVFVNSSTGHIIATPSKRGFDTKEVVAQLKVEFPDAEMQYIVDIQKTNIMTYEEANEIMSYVPMKKE
jgi:hypothetical protein